MTVFIYLQVIFAIVPPVHFCGGWLTFVCALIMMIFMTVVVGDLASIFGCLCTLEKPITAITFVALGNIIDYHIYAFILQLSPL